MANWQPFVVQVPGKDFLEPVRNVLETLLVFLEVLKTILDTIKTFLIDFGNPIKALVEALIKLIEELFLSLKQSGVFAYFDIPDPTKDPNFDKHSGGFPAFTERFKASLFDSKDFNRPQPRQGSTQSGFVILVVDASSPFALLARVAQLLRFFGREFTSPRYQPPDNLRALPVGNKGDPILAVTQVFTKGPIDTVELQWSLPTSLDTPDAGFSDVVTKVAREFIPPKFLIEKSVINPAAQKIDITDLQNADPAGTTQFDHGQYISVTSPEAVITRETLRDEYGDPVIKFQKYITIDQTDITSILGQLGKFRWLDTDIKENTVYYYRVRAYSGTLKMNGDLPAFPTKDQLSFSIESESPIMRWPSTDPNEVVIMGKPSGIVSVSIPTPIPNFDVVENLNRLFQTAFSLDFHIQADENATFDSSGNAVAPTPPSQVGKGSLTDLASSLAVFQSLPIVSTLTSKVTVNESFQPDPVTGSLPQLPWQKFNVKKQASRLSQAVASALLQSGSDSLNGFRNIMQNALPAGSITTGGSLAGDTTLEQVVFDFTPETADRETAETFVAGYSDASLRLNVLAAIQYVKTYSLGGATADWIAVVPLRDIVPWSGQILYDLLDKIRALLDAFGGTMKEISAFIDLIERKISALERFIQFLINILNLIESLQMGAYVLSVPELSGSATSWVNAIDTAGGTKPPSGPGGYSAGVSFAYVGTDITAFKTAFSIIFG